VLWARCFFPEISEIVGDVGARHLISKHTSLVREVEMGDQAVLVDVDTAEDLTALRPPA
jgi:molybdenum cofactor cytidylyltransferase